MKLYLLLPVICLSLLSCGGGESVDEYIENYNNSIVDELNAVADQTSMLLVAMENKDHRTIQLERVALKKMCSESVSTISALQGYGGDNRFRNAAIDMLNKIRKFASGPCEKVESSLLYSDSEMFNEAHKAMLRNFREIEASWDQMKQEQFNFEQKALRSYLQ